MKHIIMGTAGHIDHGKTALVKALTGIDCDTHKEEKTRGITINLGFAYLSLSTGDKVGIVDVPGHHDFVHTMVGGACGIDFVLMVVAADSGVMPQTREHLQIIDILGIHHGVIAITKIDLVEPEIVRLAEAEIEELAQGTTLNGCPIVRVSSVTGAGLERLRKRIEQVASQVPNRSVGEIFRLFIDRIFSVKGFGTVVTGTVSSGVLRAGDEAYLLPVEKKLRVRRLERYGEETKEVVAGDRASINLVGLDQADFRKGMIISDRLIRPTSIVDAKLELFKHSRSFDRVWSQVIFHLGTYEQQARVHLIDCDRLMGGDTALVQIHLETPCNIKYGDRFVVRNSSSDMTLGGGSIIDPHPLHHRKRPETLIKSMSRIAEGELQELVALEVKKHFGVITHREIAELLNVSHEQILEMASGSVPEDTVAYNSGDDLYLVTKREHDRLQEQLLENIAAHHRRNPLDKRGLATGELMSMARIERGSAGEALLKMMLEKLESEGKLKKVEQTWVFSDHSVKPDQELDGQVSFVERFLKNCNMKTPLISEMVSMAKPQNIDERKLQNILRYLVETEKLYYIDGNYIHASIVKRCRKRLLKGLVRRRTGLSVAEFRDLLQGNRKICLLLLKIYDNEGIIERSGDLRLITEKGIAALEAETSKGER